MAAKTKTDATTTAKRSTTRKDGAPRAAKGPSLVWTTPRYRALKDILLANKGENGTSTISTKQLTAELREHPEFEGVEHLLTPLKVGAHVKKLQNMLGERGVEIPGTRHTRQVVDVDALL